MSQNKPRIIKDYDKLDSSIQEQIKLVYPSGYSENLIQYTDKEGKYITALPFETEDKYYLIRMTLSEAEQIIEDDDDYDDDGFLKEHVKEEYEDKYGDIEIAAEEDESDEDDEDYEDDFDGSEEDV